MFVAINLLKNKKLLDISQNIANKKKLYKIIIQLFFAKFTKT